MFVTSPSTLALCRVQRIAGSRSVIFLGTQGIGVPCYGEGGATKPEGAVHWCFDPADGSKGCRSYPYKYWAWAYDAVDLLAVKNGHREPWGVRPYAVWEWELPLGTASAQSEGAAYDPSAKRPYISQIGADGKIPGAGAYNYAPVIQLFQLQLAAPPGAPKGLRVSPS